MVFTVKIFNPIRISFKFVNSNEFQANYYGSYFSVFLTREMYIWYDSRMLVSNILNHNMTTGTKENVYISMQ